MNEATEADDFIVERLGFCGCVEAADILPKVRAVLADLVPDKDCNLISFDELVQKHFHGHPCYAYFVLQRLEDSGLIEHGISIRCAYIIPKGEEFIKAIDALHER